MKNLMINLAETVQVWWWRMGYVWCALAHKNHKTWKRHPRAAEFTCHKCQRHDIIPDEYLR